MNQNPSAKKNDLRRGLALGIVILMAVVALALGTIMLTNSGSLLRQTADSKTRLRARYAAEGMIALQMAELDSIKDKALGSRLALEAISMMDLGTSNGEKAKSDPIKQSAASGQELITSGVFRGLRGQKVPFMIHSTGTAGSGAIAKIDASVYLYQVPIFQFGVFYEGDLEITPGPAMTVFGPVHTNGNAMLRAYGGSSLTFQGPVTAAGRIYHWLQGLAGNLVYYPSPDQPSTTRVEGLSTTMSLLSDATRPAAVNGVFNVRDQVSPLRLPIGGSTPRELILPCTGSESSSLKLQKFACQSGVKKYIEGSSSKPAWISSQKVFFDRREDNWVKFRDFDVAAALTANPHDSIFYLYDNVLATDRGSKRRTMINAFRLVNGSVLTRNVSIVSGNPVYVMGDFNMPSSTSPCRPAGSTGTVPDSAKYCNALIASDAITLLSNQWLVNDYAHAKMDGTLEQAYDPTRDWTTTHTWDSLTTSGKISVTDNVEKDWGTPDSFFIYGYPDTIRLQAAVLTGYKPTPPAFLPPNNYNDAVFNGNGEGGWIGTLRFLENLRPVAPIGTKQWWEVCPQTPAPPVQTNSSNRMTVVKFKGSFVVLWSSAAPGLAMDPSVHLANNTRVEYKACSPSKVASFEAAGPGYYGIPLRLYGFDDRFRNIDNMPPGTPFLATGIYSNWSQPR